MMCILDCFFFKQKTAYELRISDWSSDVCSSDLIGLDADAALVAQAGQTLQQLGIDNTALIEGPLAAGLAKQGPLNVILIAGAVPEIPPALLEQLDRKSTRLNSSH